MGRMKCYVCGNGVHFGETVSGSLVTVFNVLFEDLNGRHGFKMETNTIKGKSNLILKGKRCFS